MASLVLQLIIFSLYLALIHSFPAANPVKVVVTGAGSSVGYHVFKKLLQRKNFYPIGLVRNKRGMKELIKIGATPEQIRIGDIRKKEDLKGAFDGATKCKCLT